MSDFTKTALRDANESLATGMPALIAMKNEDPKWIESALFYMNKHFGGDENATYMAEDLRFIVRRLMNTQVIFSAMNKAGDPVIIVVEFSDGNYVAMGYTLVGCELYTRSRKGACTVVENVEKARKRLLEE